MYNKILYQMQSALLIHRMLKYVFHIKVCAISSDVQGKQKCVDEIVPLFKNPLLFANHLCIKDFAGQYTYLQLYKNSKKLSRQISNMCGSGSSSTVAFFTSNDILTAVILWATWLSGQKALVLKHSLSANKNSDLIKRTKAKLVISSDLYEKWSKKIAFDNCIPLIAINHEFLNIYDEASIDCKPEMLNIALKKEEISELIFPNEFYNDAAAIAIYTNENRLQIQNHKELDIQLKKKVRSWNVSTNDRILYMCPSYHIYCDEYLFNMLCALRVGSQIHLLEPFDSKVAWRAILGINVEEGASVLIAEPKAYEQMILEYEKTFAKDKRMVDYIKSYCKRNIRIMLSCFYHFDPVIYSTWLKITGHCLQETDYSTDCLNSIRADVCGISGFESIPKMLNTTIRIVNEKNGVLLELNKSEINKYQTLPVIGRIMISTNGSTFHRTGEIVSYFGGVFKIIGRYLYSPK